MTQTTNIGLKKIDGSENWRQIFDYHNDSADKTDGAVAAVQDGLAIVANGNTHAAVAEGQFVYVRNHSTLAEGLYKASSAIGTNATLSTSNLTADGSGGLNDLQEQVTSLNSNITALCDGGSWTPVLPRDTVTDLYAYWIRVGELLFITAQWTNSGNTGYSYINASSLPVPTGYRRNYGFHGTWRSAQTDITGEVGQYSGNDSMRFSKQGVSFGLPAESISFSAFCFLAKN